MLAQEKFPQFFSIVHRAIFFPCSFHSPLRLKRLANLLSFRHAGLVACVAGPVGEGISTHLGIPSGTLHGKAATPDWHTQNCHRWSVSDQLFRDTSLVALILGAAEPTPPHRRD